MKHKSLVFSLLLLGGALLVGAVWTLILLGVQIDAAITSVGTLLAGVAGAVAAVAAWRAAKASSVAAERATLALGLAIKPFLQGQLGNAGGYDGTPAYLNGGGWNDSVFPAVDIEIVFALADGRNIHRVVPRLEPTRWVGPLKVRGKPAELPLGDPIVPPANPAAREVVTIRYSDERRLLRWEWTRSYRHDGNGGLLIDEESEHQVSGS